MTGHMTQSAHFLSGFTILFHRMVLASLLLLSASVVGMDSSFIRNISSKESLRANSPNKVESM